MKFSSPVLIVAFFASVTVAQMAASGSDMNMFKRGPTDQEKADREAKRKERKDQRNAEKEDAKKAVQPVEGKQTEKPARTKVVKEPKESKKSKEPKIKEEKTKKTKDPKQTDDAVINVEEATQITEAGAEATFAITDADAAFPEQEVDSYGKKVTIGSLLSGLLAVLFF